MAVELKSSHAVPVGLRTPLGLASMHQVYGSMVKRISLDSSLDAVLACPIHSSMPMS